MLAHPITKPMHSLVSAAIVLTLVGLCIPPLAFAGVRLNTIDQVAIVTDTGRHLIVTGPLACTRASGRCSA
jgi:hypothetical protein